jgi:2-methylisocitrate lyase-like PEP mutase family enzyme
MSAHETGQLARAAQFRALHRGTVLVLPNAWDAGSAEPEDRLSDGLSRAATYAEAGADGLFVPGLTDLDTITLLADGPLPLNVMAGPAHLPSAS